jgi:hypothetical protein
VFGRSQAGARSGEAHFSRARSVLLTHPAASAGAPRRCLWVTNLSRQARGRRGQLAYIDAAHRVCNRGGGGRLGRIDGPSG